MLQAVPYYSLMIDESTDISTSQKLIMYIRFLFDGAVCTRFLQIVDLPSAKAADIFDAVVKELESKQLPLEKLIGMATDGASVMKGERNGVTTKMKRENPFLITTHCIAHRLALASGKAADSVPYLKKYQQYVNTIYKYFHYSPKHSRALEQMQAILNVAERKFQQVFHTRWPSFDGAVQAILFNYDPLVSALIGDAQSDPIAKGVLKFITTYLFVASTHLLSDVLPTLSRLSKLFQKQCVDFAATYYGVEACVTPLEGFKTTPGQRLAQFVGEIQTEPGDSFYFRDHKITDSPTQRDQFCSIKEKFLDQLIDNLKSRFPDSGTLHSFSIFDPQNLPIDSDLASYGDKQLEVLCTHYGTAKITGSGKELPCVAEPMSLRDEWVTFKQLMSKNYRTCSIQSMATKLLQSEISKEQYPNLLTLLTISLTLPVSSVDCERGFSKHNLIKTRIRGRLKTDHVSTLMKMSLDTPELSTCLDQFDFKRAFVIWCNVKDRLICRV